MKLKELEIHGFKSFARKTKIKFDNKYSVIVGPNGCGKSNISDAIRWVLGEQSPSSLRGSKMEDVVFSGTQDLGPMNYCKVSIIFDNSDKSLDLPYNEVRVTRTVYRTGESKYELNKVNVRLKDIRELLMDTGLGKEGYSIISQGKIDEILSAKPEQRRSLLDEAAGVSKYKYKRDESVKRLDNTLNNLLRVDDIMNEVEKNLNYLKKEATKAKKAIELKNQLENLELTYYKKLYQKSFNEFKEKSGVLRDLIRSKNKANKTLAGLKQMEETIKSELASLEHKLDLDRKTYNEMLEESNRTYTQVQLKSQLLENFTKDKARQEEDRLKAENKLKKLRKDIDLEKVELKSISTHLEEAENKLASLEKEYKEKDQARVKVKKASEDIGLELSGLYKAMEDFNVNLKANKTLVETFKDELRNLNRSIKDLKVDESKLKDSIGLLEGDYQGSKKLEESLKKNVSELNFKLDELRTLGQEATEDISRIKALKEKLESNHKLLSGLYSNYEGFYKPVQRFLQLAKNSKDISKAYVNPLAEEIKVEKGYEKAIKYSLGSQVQNIITETTEDAKFLIGILKKNKIGRLTFLPLDRYKTPKRNLGSLKEDDYLRNAADVLSYKPRLKPLIESLLARTIIVETMDDAVRASKLSTNRIVTLDGDIINSSGSIVGGSTKNSSTNLIGRGEEIENLEKEIKIASENLREKTQILEGLRKEYGDAEARIKYKMEDLNKAEEKTIEMIDQLDSKKGELKVLRSSIINLESQIMDKEVKSKLYELEEPNIDYLDEDIRNLEEKNKVLLKEFNDLDKNIRDLEISILDYKNKKSSLERDYRIGQNKIENLSAEVFNEQSQIKRFEDSFKLSLEEESKNIAAYEDDQNRLADLKIFLERLKIDLSKSEETIKLERNKLNDSYEDLVGLTKLVNQKDLKIEKYRQEIFSSQEKVSFKRNQILEDFAYTDQDLAEKLSGIEAKEVEESLVKKLRTDYLKISNYNEDSLEEYRQVKDEYDFYTKQREDLTKSKADVESVIKTMERKIHEDFNRAFEDINLRFNKIFARLFDGGSARLVLDTSNNLASGVEIEAKLPGKSMKNLSLLSGGERALIAVSLLFAIFETNPAPFCILDEADAALDESNITRYLDYLKSFEDIQFIIITHRKTSMEIAQKIYGVTMEEEGISKILDLEFDKALEA